MWFPTRRHADLPWPRLRWWLAGLALLLADGMSAWAQASSALPEPPTPAIAQTPVGMAVMTSLQPLSALEFDAAVIESKRRHRGRREDPVDGPWESLDPDRLRRMLQMPAFAALTAQTKEPLIDQAGAWNLLTFERPSEALALWAMLFPERQPGQPIDPQWGTHLPSLQVYRADASWATEAAATMIMMDCLSRPVWHIYAQDPMLWAMRSNMGWEMPNRFDFGICVRKSPPAHGPGRWSHSPDTDYGHQIAAVLEQKFSRLLLRQGCDGKGPDSCLHLMYALASLNPRHPQWPAILDKTALAFTPEQMPLPTAQWLQRVRDKGHPLDDADRHTLLAAHTAIARQMIYLGIRLQVLSHSATSWPQHGMRELRTTIDHILTQALAQQALGAVYIGQMPLDVVGTSFPPADPWRSFRASPEWPSALQAAVRDWARDHASAADCVLPERLLQWVPPMMALAWSLERMQQGRDTCKALPQQWIAQQYAQGRTAALAQLRTYLPLAASQHSTKHLVKIKNHSWLCTGWTDITRPPPQDPWKLCKAPLRKTQSGSTAGQLHTGQ